MGPSEKPRQLAIISAKHENSVRQSSGGGGGGGGAAADGLTLLQHTAALDDGAVCVVVYERGNHLT